MQTVNSFQSKTGIRRTVLKAPQFGAGHGKVIEKTLSDEVRRVLGIVPFGGAEWTERRTFCLAQLTLPRN